VNGVGKKVIYINLECRWGRVAVNRKWEGVVWQLVIPAEGERSI
jgi:hypothetical protein